MTKKEELLAAFSAHKAVEDQKAAIERECESHIETLLQEHEDKDAAKNPYGPYQVLDRSVFDSIYRQADEKFNLIKVLNQIELEATYAALQKAKEAYKAELLNPPVHVPAKPDRKHVAKHIEDFRLRIQGVDLTPEEFRKLQCILLERFHPV